MKTPHFWYPRQDEKTPLISNLLLPLSWLFRLGTYLRWAFAQTYRARVPLVCVGNVVAGGAGKTPTILALAQLLKMQGYKPCFVTRGYGGKRDGVCVDVERHSAVDVGDEALLLTACAPTFVARNRVQAVRMAERPGSLILMDDGFQNPHLAPSASLLVIDGESGFGNGRIIPAGPLRESFVNALKRTDAIILIGKDRDQIADQVQIPVFRAHLQPDLPSGFSRAGRFVAFAGIARPDKFFATARALGCDLAALVSYPDHHLFTEADIEDLRLKAEENGARLLTTEKDAVRLPPIFRAEVIILPVKLVFDDPGAEEALVRLITRR